MNEKFVSLKNFDCNNVSKKIGQKLTDEDIEKIGPEFIKKLKFDDWIRSAEKKPAPTKAPEKFEKSGK